MKPSNINQTTNFFLLLGCFAFTLDFILAINLGFQLGFSTQVNGWTKHGRHPIWVELIVIVLLLITLLSAYIAFNTKPSIRIKLLKFLGSDDTKLLQFINPYILVFFDAFIFYKILAMYLLGRY